MMFRAPTVLAFAGVLLVAVVPPLAAADQHASQHEKANKLVAEQKYERAIKLLKAANGKVGDSCVECYLGLAGAFQSTGELRKAEKQVRQAFELASDPIRKAFALNRLGLILFSGGDGDPRNFQEAAEAFEAIVEISQGRAFIAYYNLGEVLLKLERDAEGVEALQKFAEAAPDSSQIERVRYLIADPRRARMELLPDFALTTLQGESIRSEDLKGQVVVFDFWATWCPPCVASIPHLQLMSRRAKKEGFKLVSISVDQTEKTLKKFIEQHGMDWPQHWDPNGPSLGTLFRITAYPTYVVVGHDGVVAYRRSGWSERIASELDQAVRSALRAASKEARRGG